MKIEPTPLEGVFLLLPEKIHDERGFFARTICARELGQAGLHTDFVQSNVSYNKSKGTFRGLHYQKAPKEEVKIVRCTRGAIFDIAVDLRPASRTFKQWFGVQLSCENHVGLYVPRGCAHGFQTLEDDCEAIYFMGGYHEPSHAAGVRWNDPGLRIQLPLPLTVISERDLSYPDLQT